MRSDASDPVALLERYPAVRESEGRILLDWLAVLRSRTLVKILSDRRLGPKLVALRQNEPELALAGRRMLWAAIAAGLISFAFFLAAVTS